MISIIDYGAGNLLSVKNALDHIGCECKVVTEKQELFDSDAAILPGVGSFGNAMESMQDAKLVEPILSFIESGKPFLGICLGLQLLFQSSEESPNVKGLGVLKGEILKIPNEDGTLKIPHIGWNSLSIKNHDGIFSNMQDSPYVYFVHSYYLKAHEDIVTSTADYGVEIHASIQKGNVFATQFHPEKSGDIGIQMLKNFVERIGK